MEELRSHADAARQPVAQRETSAARAQKKEATAEHLAEPTAARGRRNTTKRSGAVPKTPSPTSGAVRDELMESARIHAARGVDALVKAKPAPPAPPPFVCGRELTLRHRRPQSA